MCCFGPRRRHGAELANSPQTTQTPAASLCRTCSALGIGTILRDGLPRENMIPLGPLADIIHRADHCRLCHLVASLIQRNWCLDALPNVDLSDVVFSLYATSIGFLTNLEDKKRCHRLCIGHSRRPHEVTDVLTRAHMSLTIDIQLLEEDAHRVLRSKELHGRRMASTVDMELVKGWVALCEREHGDACESVWWRGSDVQLPRFVRMVDVTLMSVVQAPYNCRYVALSYVWGTAGDEYWTTTANIGSRGSPAGIDSSILPATIKDSIHVTQVLGERYLWIDALCIVQDNSEDKGLQIQVMDLIYSRALVTIIAAGRENARARLPGLTEGSRHLNQHVEVIQDLHLTAPLPSLRETIAQSIWDTRGWTFQELMLSRRRLFFTNQQVYYECAKDVWCEDTVAESNTMLYSHNPLRYPGSGARLFMAKPPERGWADYMMGSGYANVVGRYTQRRLSHQSDVIYAITAFTNAMTKGYKLARGNPAQAFRYGTEISNLDYSLLWQPRLNSAHSPRINSETGQPVCPSWAWAGWTGAAYYSDLNQLMDTAITTGVLPTPEESLIAGWYIIDDDRQLVRLDVRRMTFIRIEDSAPAESSTYVVPECRIDKQLLDPLPPAGTLLFRTQCASFRVAKVDSPSSASASEPLPHSTFHILSEARKPSAGIGLMILPSSTPSPTVFEFIVLSRCDGLSGVYDEDVYGDVYDGCMLHVMAVKRRLRDNMRVRERVGLGVIFEQAWLECSAKVETVLLG